MDLAITGPYEEYLWIWNVLSLDRLYLAPGCDIALQFCKMLPLGETG